MISRVSSRDRSLSEGLLDAPDAEPVLVTEPVPEVEIADYRASLADFLIPLGVLLGLAVGGHYLLPGSWINEAFLCATLSAMVPLACSACTEKNRAWKRIGLTGGVIARAT